MTSTAQQQGRFDHQGDLEIVSVTKRFGDFVAVDDLTLTVPQGSFFALLGASGCGKTTTLRMVAGLETPTSGRIELGGKDIAGLKPYKRPVNTVFQSYALFPHMTVEDNVAFGLRRTGASDVRTKVGEMLELVQLEQYAKRRPAQLSGGQQQRVALGRALINRPQVLLLDEPLGALDLKLRRSMQLELKRIQTEVGITFVHVTHDQEEAMTMADTIAVMNAGRIEQLGAPADLYEHPQSTFVANFLGQSNLLEGVVTRAGSGEYDVTVQGAGLRATRVTASGISGRCWIGVRPEKVTLQPPGEGHDAGLNRLSGGRVEDVSFVGVSTQYLIGMPWGQELAAFEQNTGKRSSFAVGDQVDLTWMPDHTFLLDSAQDASAGSEIDDE
ncbi:ABC transporter ATP-binding protein [Nocardioides marmoribigeumensis]|uniref:Spermidine/putrescine import ATP-binding protein PotA n=1 Tax=Nocardioides marmoribigeumensis TaxID=433649 RepID=A0ABU2BS14_9ACTN|nr:ABC transporter ATP-binding protein [Nocardioides marmoribigeumensis]MDR7361422.1 spermidine/putrescine transport system ATP-binding protein [Nocardioides marmoribigeumensis]